MTIQWLNQFAFEAALQQSGRESKPVLLDFHSLTCTGCQSLEAITYSDSEVIRAVMDHVIPVRVVTTEPDSASTRVITRYISISTPTVQLVSSEGTVYHYWRGAPRHTRPAIGYRTLFCELSGRMSPARFLAQLLIGRGKAALRQGSFDESSRLFDAVVSQYPTDESAIAEAHHWAVLAGSRASVLATAQGMRVARA